MGEGLSKKFKPKIPTTLLCKAAIGQVRAKPVTELLDNQCILRPLPCDLSPVTCSDCLPYRINPAKLRVLTMKRINNG